MRYLNLNLCILIIISLQVHVYGNYDSNYKGISLNRNSLFQIEQDIQPKANAGPDQIIFLPTNQVTLSGSGSAYKGDITSYQWTQIDGLKKANIISSKSAKTQVTGLVEGVYTFQLTVRDNRQATAKDNVIITVTKPKPPQNRPPTANAGPDQTITLPKTTIVLTGSGKDSDGQITSYKWTKVSGPQQGRIVSSTNRQTGIDRLVQGVYTFQLTVRDNRQATGKDNVIVTVKPAQNRAPTANAGSDKTITLPTNNVVLSGSGTDADGQITSYKWTKVSGPQQGRIVSSTNRQTGIDRLVQGVYTFQLTVRDNRQATGKDNVIVTVKPAQNRAPTANAGSDKTITLPTNNVVLSGSGTDTDGQIISYRWTKVSGPQQGRIVSSTNRQTGIDRLVQGVYTFQLTVRDNRQATGKDNVIVTVKPAQNRAPTANAGSDKTITLPTNNVVLSGSGTDTDGQIISYRWTKVSGPQQGRIVSSTNRQTGIDRLVQGVYTFQLTVRDNRQATGKDNVIVTVKPAQNRAPTANAGSDKTITLPTNNVVLSGSGTDSDGQIISYRWTKVSGPQQGRIVSSTNRQTGIDRLVQGTYTFQLSVTDDKGESATDRLTVKVNSEYNVTLPPIANAGPDQTISLPTNEVELSGSGSFGGDANTKFRWTMASGPSNVEFGSQAQAQTKILNLAEGVYEFEFTVKNSGGSSSDRVIIKVNPKPFPWILWIFIGVLVAGVLIAVGLNTSLKYLFIVPISKKVMVFFMHEDEKQLVRKLMPDSHMLDHYAIGHCDAGKIKKMKKKGLAIHILNTTDLHINTPGQTRTMKNTAKKGKSKWEDLGMLQKPGIHLTNEARIKDETELRKDANDFPTFYLISLDEPLLPDYEKQLENIGVEVLQHVPKDNYIVHIENKEQLNNLNGSGFEFIRHHQHYTSFDTGLTIREEHRKQAAEKGDKIYLDLILHREEDLSNVKEFLKGLDVNIIQSYKNRIRISASASNVKDLNLSDNKYIQAIYEYIHYELHNDVARHLVGVDAKVSGESYISETGEGEIIAVADTGIDLNHPDLKSQIIEAVSWGRKVAKDTSDFNGHGTHVTGTIVGDGTASNGKIKGIAPGAKVFFQSLLDDDESLVNIDMLLLEILKEAYEKGARIHNNSWGSATEARYTYDSNTVDEFVYKNPEMLVVVSAGNEGSYNSRNAKEKGYIGFGSICSPATNKNGLTVGASRNERKEGGRSSYLYGVVWPEKFPFPPTSKEKVSGDPEELAAFSSRGKCDDSRVKPDIIAPGTDILSTKSELAPLRNFHGGFEGYKESYAFLGGTSMAAPILSGAAAIVREYYKKKKKCNTMSAALVKATLINGTFKLGSKSALYRGDMIPNPNQGYGMLDLSMTIPNKKNLFQLEYIDSLQDPSVILKKPGAGHSLKLHLKQKSWIRVCLAFTDVPGRAIQNDLDLIIDYDQTREKWSGNIGINAEDNYASSDEDRTNNMEIIRIDKAEPGLYTVNVVAHNIPLKKKKQGFSLVVTTNDMTANFEKY